MHEGNAITAPYRAPEVMLGMWRKMTRICFLTSSNTSSPGSPLTVSTD